MTVCVVLEQRFDRTPDGAVWTSTAFPYEFWRRYLDVFEEVRVVARVQDVDAALPSWHRADGDRVSFARVPYYIGPLQFLRHWRAVRHAVREAIGPRDAVILRVASQLAASAVPLLRHRRQSYGVEVVSDPKDAFAKGSIRHPLRPFFEWWFPRQLRAHCADACAAAYVTREALQRRYPSRALFSTHYSSIELPASAIASRPRQFAGGARRWTLIFVGSLAQLYKAPDVLIDAVAGAVSRGLDLQLVMIGDGKHRPELEARVASHGMTSRVTFAGQLPRGAAIFEQLDRADLFVLPSHTEGLPRAMIEAMARGLPCIGTNVGGIPELLRSEDLVPPGDTAALERKIRDVLQDPARLESMSARSLDVARDYEDETLRRRRRAFYTRVRECASNKF